MCEGGGMERMSDMKVVLCTLGVWERERIPSTDKI